MATQTDFQLLWQAVSIDTSDATPGVTERLRYLRDRWMRRLDGQKGIRLHTSFDPAMSCGLANVEIVGLEPGAVAEHLWKTQRIFITPIVHAEYKGIRVTPNVYTRLQEVDLFAESMEHILANGTG